MIQYADNTNSIDSFASGYGRVSGSRTVFRRNEKASEEDCFIGGSGGGSDAQSRDATLQEQVADLMPKRPSMIL
jgi:hypothetical protein